MDYGARQHIRTLDGRTIEILATPPAIGWTLLFHGGTPTAPVSFAPLEVETDRAWLEVASAIGV